jgi:hypothetical protein
MLNTDKYMPLRGNGNNGWYYHNLICYCLDKDIIKLENIKYVIRSSLSLPKRYYNKLIEYCYKILKIIVNLRLIQ